MKTIWKKILGYLTVVFGAVAASVVWQVFISANAFAPAGVVGITTMIQYSLGISVGYMMLLINLPLCILAMIFLNRDYAVKTFLYVLLYSGAMLVLRYGIVDLSAFVYKTDNGTSTVLAPLAAGVLEGGLYGFVMRVNGSSGGTDVIAALVHKKNPDRSIAWLIFSMNAVVAVVSYFVYGYHMEPVICCILYAWVSGSVMDIILRGADAKVQFQIVTDTPDALSREIISRLRHGATAIPARGMYSGRDKSMLICVVQKSQVRELQEIMEEYPGSFAILSTVTGVVGQYTYVDRNPRKRKKRKAKGKAKKMCAGKETAVSREASGNAEMPGNPGMTVNPE
ncbi:MAG: YitT family protein, partial [Lachnospiraceae bacterium]|nr:YitT family protein [Lachnospiraceae bacterium]